MSVWAHGTYMLWFIVIIILYVALTVPKLAPGSSFTLASMTLWHTYMITQAVACFIISQHVPDSFYTSPFQPQNPSFYTSPIRPQIPPFLQGHNPFLGRRVLTSAGHQAPLWLAGVVTARPSSGQTWEIHEYTHQNVKHTHLTPS